MLSPAERLRWSVTTRHDGRSMAQLVHDSPEGLRLALSVLEQVWRVRAEAVAEPLEAKTA